MRDLEFMLTLVYMLRTPTWHVKICYEKAMEVAPLFREWFGEREIGDEKGIQDEKGVKEVRKSKKGKRKEEVV